MLVQTDVYVGELLERIDGLGIRDNTVFIFTSDNDREGIPRSFGFTGPWRGGMFSPYEGSLRVPFLIRWPSKIPSERVSNEMVHQIDILPALARFTGAAIPRNRVIDGLDQSDFFEGKTERSARESL